MEKKISIAVVEDNDEDRTLAVDILHRYESEHGYHFDVELYSAGGEFLSKYRSQYDILLLDINLENSNGIDIARKIREKDEDVIIVFTTNLARYATYGYVVGALDFALKPLSYASFCLKIDRAMKLLSSRHSQDIVLQADDGYRRVNLDDILYIEIYAHDLVFHLVEGELRSYGTLKKYEESLGQFGFLRCNSCYLVNVRHILRVEKHDLYLRGGTILKISHPKRKTFMDNFRKFIIEGGH